MGLGVDAWGGPVTLGKSGITTSRLGLSSGYGIGESDALRAFDAGVRYFYFGSRRTGDFGRAMAQLGPRRDEATVVVQSYARAACAIRGSLERALKAMGTDRADVLLLGWWSRIPGDRILEEAAAIKDAGLARTIMISSHDRPTLVQLANDARVDSIMLRYSAAHPGAEREVFPMLGERRDRRVGVVAYTATRWGMLVDPKRTPKDEATPRASDCYRFALSDDHVDVCVTGPKNGEELDEALQAIARGPMSPDEIAWMKRVGAAVRDGAKREMRGMGMGLLDRLFASV
jgi:aryl-alcohol dehydrogenase-like predicted oxidoreductase